MLYRFRIETFSRKNEDDTDERLREIGLDSWALISVLPGTRDNPADPEHFTCFFSRDASEDIGI
jgi:hypothetical protein